VLKDWRTPWTTTISSIELAGREILDDPQAQLASDIVDVVDA
jgi:hypothetical protein